MTTFPVPLERRFTEAISGLLRRVTLLESRTANFDSSTNIQAITGVIDPSYVAGAQPMVTLTGATALSGPYQCLPSYTPVAGDTVLMVPLGSSWVIAGRPTTTGPDTWHAMTLANGWSNNSGVDVGAAYKLLPTNAVHIVGCIAGGTTSTGSVVIATLPAAYTPAHYVHFPIATFGIAPAAGTEGFVNTSGQVLIAATSGATRVDFNTVIPLDA